MKTASQTASQTASRTASKIVVEKVYSVRETALLLGYEASWVRRNIERCAAYGPVYKLAADPNARDKQSADYRISARAINGLLEDQARRGVDRALKNKKERAGAGARHQERAVEKLYSLGEAALLLGCEVSVVRQVCAPHGPVYRVADGDRISAEAINGAAAAAEAKEAGVVSLEERRRLERI